MYSQLLGVDKVGRRDDFFELGGHSLLAVRLLVQIEKEFTKVIPLPVLFQSATIEGLAAFLRGDEGSKPTEFERHRPPQRARRRAGILSACTR